MFSNARVGDRVWDFAYGWGSIKNIGSSTNYPILVRFDNAAENSFDYNGYIYSYANQTLFWDEIKFEIPKKPLTKLEVDTKVIVWDNELYKYNRYFSHFTESGKICCFESGATSWSTDKTTCWNNWELADKETK